MFFVALAQVVLVVLANGEGPCNILDAAGNPCVAAHSISRALFESYHGPLYQVLRTSDGASINISTLSPGGLADAAAQTKFCRAAQPPPAPPARSYPWAPGPCKCTVVHGAYYLFIVTHAPF